MPTPNVRVTGNIPSSRVYFVGELRAKCNVNAEHQNGKKYNIGICVMGAD